MSNKLSLIVNFVGIDKMSGALRNIVGLGKKGSSSLNALRGEGRKLEQQLKKVRSELAGASGNITALAAREQELERAIMGVNRQMERQQRLAAIDSRTAAMRARGDQLMARGQENMVQGASLAAPLILATKAAADFSSGMVDIQQKAGLTNAQTDRLANNVVRMSKAAKLMPEDVRSGLDVLLAKGMDLDAATAAIGPAGRLATAYKVAIPDAASAAHASITNLKIPARETARIFDMMAAAGNEGAFEVRNMAQHFPALTAQMQALGEKGAPAVADLSAALQVAMRTAGSEDQAANNIQNLLAKINAPGTIRAFEKNFGVNLPAAMKKFTDEGYTSLEAIALITEQATGGDMKKLGFAFEDMQARQGIMALIQNLDEYRRVRKAALESGGTVDRAFDQRVARDATVQWTAFKSSVSSLAITLGATLLPVANEVLSIVGGMASKIAAWAQVNPEAAATLTKLVAGLAVFKLGLGAAQWAIGGFLKPFASLYGLIAKVPMARSVLGMLGNTFLMLGKQALRAGLMMLANPIVLAIVALVAVLGFAGYQIYKHWDTIKAAFWQGVAALGQAWNTIKQAFATGITFLLTLPIRMANIGRQIILGIARGITRAASAVWNALKSVVLGGIRRVTEFLGIKSPSRVFMEIGGHTADGMALGIERRGKRAISAAGRMATGVTAAGAIALTPVAAAAGPGAATGPSATASAASAGMSGAKIEIHVHQLPGQDTRALAIEIRRELERLDRVAARSSFEDS